MSINQSGIRRSLGKHDDERVSKFVQLADFVGFAHFVGANIIALIGEFTNLFSHISSYHGGIAFIYATADWPVYSMVSGWASLKGDWVVVWGKAQLIFIASSVLYALIVYIFTKIIKALMI